MLLNVLSRICKTHNPDILSNEKLKNNSFWNEKCVYMSAQ